MRNEELICASHPWINYDVDITRLSSRAWLQLGEAMANAAHVRNAPLKPGAAKELAAVYLASGVHATTAIEGNTLSERDIRRRMVGERDLPPSKEYLGLEVDNIIEAIQMIDNELRRGQLPTLDTDRLFKLHGMVLKGIVNPPDDVPGQPREHNVGVNLYAAPNWGEVRSLLDRLFKWLDDLQAPADASPRDQFVNAVLRAILAHLYIAWIHPFGNGNGRTARLVEVQILAQSGLVPLVATNLMSNHYNKTRSRYYERLSRASTHDDVMGFLHYAIEGFADELAEQAEMVGHHNIRVAWESYIHETFGKHQSTQAKDRQRRLMLELPVDRFVTKDEAIELSPRLARLYALAGERTPARDLNDLVRMGLVRKHPSKKAYRGRLEVVLGFRSPVARGDEFTSSLELPELPMTLTEPP